MDSNTAPDSSQPLHSKESVDDSKIDGKKGRGPSKLMLVSGQQNPKVLERNEFGQPIGDNSVKYASFLGCMVKEFVPYTLDGWNDIDEDLKSKMWSCLQLHNVEDWEKKTIFQKLGKLWHDRKSRLQILIREVNTGQAASRDLSLLKPEFMDQNQWDIFVKKTLSLSFQVTSGDISSDIGNDIDINGAKQFQAKLKNVNSEVELHPQIQKQKCITFLLEDLVGSRYMEDPTTTHLKIAKRILRYIKGSIDFGLLYSTSNQFKLEGYSDRDWGGDMDDTKSTTRFVLFMGDTAFTWMLKKQPIVTLSTCEAEYVVATSCVWSQTQLPIGLALLLGDANKNVVQEMQPQPLALLSENTTEFNKEDKPLTFLSPLSNQNVEQERRPQSSALPLENVMELNEEGQPLTSLPPLSDQNVERGMQTQSPHYYLDTQSNFLTTNFGAFAEELMPPGRRQCFR
ncbi:hypothetical protein ZIOFF_060540 [Zingiber officinale]|uniref:Uncharacterized protein n=1 Tax=Zingiber officinale TaxID=94328 RepID=A0A8J5KC65_ZINOF|nr:hypothetical protein ZIOFF_060540 [Zingiber officinale]